MKYKIVIIFFKLLSLLPFRVLYLLSDIIAFFFYHIIKYRKKDVRRNLISSFPDKSQKEIKKIEKKYYLFMCDVMIETVKLLSINKETLSKRIEVRNAVIVNQSVEQNRSAVLFLGHYGNWEWVQEIGNYLNDKVYRGSIYHEMRSGKWEQIFHEIRKRWNLVLLPQNKAVRALLDKSHLPWIFGFIADQRPRNDDPLVHTDFLNHETQFIIGTEEIGHRVNANYFYIDVERPKRGYYILTFIKLEPEQESENYPYTRSFWKEFEKSIIKCPYMWLWSHRRWK